MSFTEIKEEDVGNAASAVRKFSRRVLPLLIVLSISAYLDRMNIAFAKLQMTGELGLSEAAFGLGASMYYIGYILFDLPSNAALARFGAGRWFTVITFGWGLTTLALAFTRDPTGFYILRFVLGAFEAGFFPGIVYYTTIWLPYAQRAKASGAVMAAGTFAYVIGSPLCGAMLELNGVGGMRGWQWVFVSTAIPALLIAPLLPWLLPDSPEKAKFLTEAEKAILIAETCPAPGAEKHSAWASIIDGRVWRVAMPLVGLGIASMGLTYWLPTIVAGFGVSPGINGWLNVIPWICVTAALWWLPARAERLDRRRSHTVLACIISAVALASLPVIELPVVQLIMLSIAAAGIYGIIPIYWALPSRFLSGPAAAAGIGVIGSIGTVGGFAGQVVIPWLYDLTGSRVLPMLFISISLIVTALLSLGLFRTRTDRPPSDRFVKGPVRT